VHFSFTDSLTNFKAHFLGPLNSIYEGRLFEIEWELPKKYPRKTPKVLFATKVFHPNIGEAGEINLTLLKDEWSPILGFSKLLLSICSLLDDPDTSCPLNSIATHMFEEDRLMYNSIARDWVCKYSLENHFGLKW
jgi:ubiquitin-conjugating enzyme E2 D/E